MRNAGISMYSLQPKQASSKVSIEASVQLHRPGLNGRGSDNLPSSRHAIFIGVTWCWHITRYTAILNKKGTCSRLVLDGSEGWGSCPLYKPCVCLLLHEGSWHWPGIVRASMGQCCKSLLCYAAGAGEQQSAVSLVSVSSHCFCSAY